MTGSLPNSGGPGCNAANSWGRVTGDPSGSDLSDPARYERREEMRCDRCKRRHGVVWFAPSDIWNAVMRGGVRGNPDEFSFCCPICFMRLAEKRGVVTTAWRIAPEEEFERMREALERITYVSTALPHARRLDRDEMRAIALEALLGE